MERFLKLLSILTLITLLSIQIYNFAITKSDNLLDVFEDNGVPLENEMYVYKKGFVEIQLGNEFEGNSINPEEVFVIINGEEHVSFASNNPVKIEVKENDQIEIYNSSVINNGLNASIINKSDDINSAHLSDEVYSNRGREILGRIVFLG